MQKLLGGTYVGDTETVHTYLAPLPEYEAFLSGFTQKYPMTFKLRLPLIELKESGATVAATLCLPYSKADDPKAFSSIHSNPPGKLTQYPTLVLAEYGKGKVIWSAAPLELDRRRQYVDVMERILMMGAPQREWSLTCDARRQVELLGYRREKGYYVCAVDLLFDDERISTRSFTVRLRLKENERIRSVRLLPTMEKIAFSLTDGVLTFPVPEFELISMIEVIPE